MIMENKLILENTYKNNKKVFTEAKYSNSSMTVYCDKYDIKPFDRELQAYHVVLRDEYDNIIGFCHAETYEEKDVYLS